MTQTSFGHRLRLLRAERQLSLRQAAARAGMVKETISDIERGATHPQDVTLAKLAHAYDVPVEDLLEEPALTGKGEAPQETEPQAPEAPIHDPYGWVRRETTEDLKQRVLEEARFAKPQTREELVKGHIEHKEAQLKDAHRRTMAFHTIIAINEELGERGVRSPVELAVKLYNEVMGADSVPEEGAGEASEAG